MQARDVCNRSGASFLKRAPLIFWFFELVLSCFALEEDVPDSAELRCQPSLREVQKLALRKELQQQDRKSEPVVLEVLIAARRTLLLKEDRGSQWFLGSRGLPNRWLSSYYSAAHEVFKEDLALPTYHPNRQHRLAQGV
ncbi:hypothetical protein NDU88_002025 [Pleurodeles waltl]|uniref:Uncharacterized protein n=1 Tax=Pleurodeles waltl TaxID=8319 RepID=A0AAV7REN2_PLEWA|nr:hypothetical protein NDU88_002025 [Pleurodeles waltl]